MNESIMARRTIGGSKRARACIGVGMIRYPSAYNAKRPSAETKDLLGHAPLPPPPATAWAEGFGRPFLLPPDTQLNGRPFPATASAEGAQLNAPPSLRERVRVRVPKVFAPAPG